MNYFLKYVIGPPQVSWSLVWFSALVAGVISAYLVGGCGTNVVSESNIADLETRVSVESKVDRQIKEAGLKTGDQLLKESRPPTIVKLSTTKFGDTGVQLSVYRMADGHQYWLVHTFNGHFKFTHAKECPKCGGTRASTGE